MAILLPYGKPDVNHLPDEVEERHDAVICPGEYTATYCVAPNVCHAPRMACPRRVELAELVNGVEGGGDLRHPEVLELRLPGLRLGHPVPDEGDRDGPRNLVVGVGSGTREPVDDEAVVGTCVAQGLDALETVMLVAHDLLSPPPRAIAPHVGKYAELNHLEEHPDRIRVGIVSDEVARVLIVRPTVPAPGVERTFDPGALARAYGP